MPVVLSGIAGGLLFLLARRFANPWVALLTWIIWTTSPGNLRFLPGYFSQNTTIVLWLLGWWALADWLEGKGAGWLMLLSACVAWGVLTRPFTTVGYAVAAGFVVFREVLRKRAWRDLALALLPAAAVLAIIPVWSLATTGDALMTPYELYSKIYFPYQRPGFGLPAAAAPQRALPPDMARYGEGYRAMHAAHTLASVPKDLADRLRGIVNDTWGQSRWPLSLFAFLGLFVLPGPGVFALVSGVLLVVCHIPFAHPWIWSLYYLELPGAARFRSPRSASGRFSSAVRLAPPAEAAGVAARSPRARRSARRFSCWRGGPLASDVVASRERHYIRMAYQRLFPVARGRDSRAPRDRFSCATARATTST